MDDTPIEPPGVPPDPIESELARRHRDAHREAGHAVTAWATGLTFDSVSILTGDDAPVMNLNLDHYGTDPPSNLQFAVHLVMVAGYVAVEILTGERYDFGAWVNPPESADVPMAFTGDPQNSREYVDTIADTARDQFDTRAFWPGVVALADALLADNTVAFDDVARIIQAAGVVPIVDSGSVWGGDFSQAQAVIETSVQEPYTPTACDGLDTETHVPRPFRHYAVGVLVDRFVYGSGDAFRQGAEFYEVGDDGRRTGRHSRIFLEDRVFVYVGAECTGLRLYGFAVDWSERTFNLHDLPDPEWPDFDLRAIRNDDGPLTMLVKVPEEFGGGAMVLPVPISQQFPDMTHEDIRRHRGEVRQEIARLREQARELRRAKRFKHFKPQHLTPKKLEAEADRIEKILNDAMGGDT